ncbi:MAG: protein-L-isoaspartate(D-aspartate) O-methyltransferase [Pseudomonadota bacterium]
MVEEQLIARGVSDDRVIAAVRELPREAFLDEEQECHAYEDRPLGIGHGQTISQPFIAAHMCELCELSGGERVLEVGAGCGYVAGLLAALAREVFAVEIVAALAQRARANLAVLGIDNVRIESLDGTLGWPEHAPYDVILVSAGAPEVPPLLLHQLADPGRLVMPVGSRERQRLIVVNRRGDSLETNNDIAVRFVDLTGRYGCGSGGTAKA